MSEDDSSPAIHVDYSACILCDRCIRGCSEIRHNNVIARQGKGYFTTIAFDANEPMGNSSCVSCGECMVSCPTGALTNKKVLGQNLLKQIQEENGPRSKPTRSRPKTCSRCPSSRASPAPSSNSTPARSSAATHSAGEIIVREGENGSTAFYILEGDADVYLGSPRAHVTTRSEHQASSARCEASCSPKKTKNATKSAPKIPPTSASTLPSTCPTTIPIASSAPAISSAK